MLVRISARNNRYAIPNGDPYPSGTRQYILRGNFKKYQKCHLGQKIKMPLNQLIFLIQMALVLDFAYTDAFFMHFETLKCVFDSCVSHFYSVWISISQTFYLARSFFDFVVPQQSPSQKPINCICAIIPIRPLITDTQWVTDRQTNGRTLQSALLPFVELGQIYPLTH